MNMMMVEVTHVSNLKSGNPVTLIGTDGDEYLSAGQLAEWSQTINYEILSRINPNITRILKPSSNS
jgi:alanine racemase